MSRKLNSSWITLLLLASACAYGDSNDTTNFTPPGATPDAGTCPYDVYRHQANGWLLTHPQVHFVFWGSYWTGSLQGDVDQSQYYKPWDVLLNGGNVLDRLSQYGIGSGSFDTNVYNSNANLLLPTGDGGLGQDTYYDASTDAQAQILTVLPTQFVPNELNNEIQVGLLPVPDSNTFYGVFLPPGYIPTNDYNLTLGGFHGYGSYGSQKYTFAIFLYSGWFDEMMGIISHELYEASTNPDVANGWFDDNTGEEVADLCQVANEPFWWETIDGYSVQKVWSQQACTCN
jgi:hypothetical protein